MESRRVAIHAALAMTAETRWGCLRRKAATTYLVHGIRHDHSRRAVEYSPSALGSFPFPLRFRLNMRLCRDDCGEFGLVGEVGALPLMLRPSLVTVFSTESDRRFTRLRERSLSEGSAKPTVSGSVLTVTAAAEGGRGDASGGT
jgi:hypothetical protein